MTKIASTYEGSLRTESVHLASNTSILTDAPVDNHGKGEAFSPTDLVAAALGSCMATIMGIHARKLGADLSGLKWHTEKIMRANPRAIAEIKIHFELPKGQLTEAQKVFLEEKARSCPVALSLSPDLKQQISFAF